MSTIDQQFVEYIVKTLVNNPEKVSVERTIDERGVLLKLTVDGEDVGRVIGRKGYTAQAIRTLLRALGTKNDARYNLKIVNTEEGKDITSDNPSNDVEEPTSEEDVSIETEQVEEEEPTSDIAERTRAELADLDDLDI
ncbi:KH domain-containing protein [Candidatus Saccharibacteria bacterium]|nr:KH domain-containing protein [Candidatus Saccharibacteria bacterium]